MLCNTNFHFFFLFLCLCRLQEQQFNRRRAAAMNIRMQAMSQQSSMTSQTTPGGSKEEMSPSGMSPHQGMGGMGSPHHVSGVKPGNPQQTTQKPPPAVLQVVKQVNYILLKFDSLCLYVCMKWIVINYFVVVI